MNSKSRAYVRVVVPERVYRCGDPLVGPHNRCRHPEALPAGFEQCAGDPGCTVRIPGRLYRRGVRHCFWHAEDAAVRASDWQGRMEKLMGADL